MVDWGALGPGRLCSNLPGEQIRVVLVPMPPGCRTVNPGSTPGLSAHVKPSAELRNGRGSAHKQGGSWRTYPPSGTGLNPLPPERSLQTGIRAFRPTSSPLPGRTRQRGRGASPRLPRWPRSACPDAAGRGPKYVQSPLILQRGRLSRPCLRRSLSAAALRGRHGIRHPSCKPELGAPGSNRPAACCGTP